MDLKDQKALAAKFVAVSDDPVAIGKLADESRRPADVECCALCDRFVSAPNQAAVIAIAQEVDAKTDPHIGVVPPAAVHTPVAPPAAPVVGHHIPVHVDPPKKAEDPEAIIQTFSDRMNSKAVKAQRTFDPSWILSIINVLAMLFKNCPTPPTPAQIKKRPLLLRARLHSELRKEFGDDMKRKGIGDMVSDVFDVAHESKDDEVDKFCANCKHM